MNLPLRAALRLSLLSPTQAKIVEALLPGTWMRAADLRDAIAPGTSVKNIHVQIFKLREKVGDLLDIEGVSGTGDICGYRLAGVAV